MNNFEELTLQQQRFCDEYLVSFNAFRAAICAGYSETVRLSYCIILKYRLTLNWVWRR